MQRLKMPTDLELFEELQDHHVSDIVDMMRSDWVYKVYGMMERLLPQGKAQNYAELMADALENGAGELDMVRPHAIVLADGGRSPGIRR